MTIDDSQLRPCVICGHEGNGLAVVREDAAGDAGQKWAEGRAVLLEVSTVPYGECLYAGAMLHEGEIEHVELPVWVDPEPRFETISSTADDDWRRVEVASVDFTFMSMGAPEVIDPVQHDAPGASQ